MHKKRRRPLKSFQENRQRWISTGSGLLLTLLMAWIHVSPPPGIASLIQRLDLMVYDLRYGFMPTPQRVPQHRIVIVDIDEFSLQQEGQWPWDRGRLAQLLQRLEEAGVLVVGFDMNFPEPQRNAVAELLTRLDDEVLSQRLAAEAEQFDADYHFAEAIASPVMDVVLALSFNPQQRVEYGVLPEPLVEIEERLAAQLSLQDMAGYTGNIPPLRDAAAGGGSMNQMPDVDGVVRRVPLLLRYQDQLYPALALEMARLYFLEDSFALTVHETSSGNHLEAIRLGASGQYEIPTDRYAQVLVPYVGASILSGASHYDYISAADILAGDFDTALLENALVLIGTTAPGLYDLSPTPVASVFPGVEIHANILNGLLGSVAVQELGQETGNREPAAAFPYKPVWEAGAILVLLLVAGAGLSFVLPLTGPVVLTLLSISLIALAVVLNFALWSVYRLDLALTVVVGLLVLLASSTMVWGFLCERQTRRAIKDMFERYVPPEHIDAMLADPQKYTLSGESRELTVLFADIRDFTTISESLPANELKRLLNEYLTPVTEVIFAHNGTVDKYVGDMVMAFWGAPLEDPEHPANAVRAALAMQREVANMGDSLRAKSLPEIKLSIGINTGLMNVGDMGSEYRRAYTVIGDSVNLASRLEGLTRYYGIPCLIGEQTCAQLTGFLCRRIDRVRVKGQSAVAQIWEPLCESDNADRELHEQVKRWHAALDAYYQRHWEEARSLMRELQQEEPDCPLYTVYLKRIDTLEKAGLPADWDGVTVHRRK